jgi:signal transduction histidine kinase/DNA-binding response OmpR family regulator
MVSAIGPTQQWSEPARYAFTIRPPWWLAWWAYIGYFLIGGGAISRWHRFRLNRKLELAEKKRLQELDDYKNKLYTNITHEFRSPLTLIHGPVSHALTTGRSLETKELSSIYRQSERMQQLITQMLDLQKIEAGKMKIFYKHGDIIQKIRMIFDLFESWAREKEIQMSFSADPPELFMDYDDDKLTQIISNLLSNAIKHTQQHGKIGVMVNRVVKHNTLLIVVQDTGIGISPEDLPYIFDRYYQSSRAAAGGTGIGMALTKNLVELLDGSITVESQLDFGTTFRISLPIIKQAEYVAAETVVRPDPILSESFYEESTTMPLLDAASDKPIVLVVEDHPEVMQYIASCLAPEYSIITATDGVEGLQKAFEYIPDLIISDVMMPRKDGFELCATLKKDIQTSHIPIILLTGRGDHTALMSGIEYGADAYVVKPFDPSELLLRVKKLLELRANLSLHYRQISSVPRIQAPAHVSVRENEFLLSIRLFVEEHISDTQFNMDMLCQHLAMSHPQLHRKITALTGESTGKFVRSIRLSKAKELLLNSDLTVSEIAYETGFSEPGYFTKVFSKEFDQSPSAFRAKPK